MIAEPIYTDNIKMAASAPSAPVTKMRFTAVKDPVSNDPKLYQKVKEAQKIKFVDRDP